MEGDCRSETPPPSADIGCANELNRLNSDASTLTAENCEDILHLSANVKPDDCATWTDEKHGLYLEHLEVSFVKQLHQSMGLLAQCSEQNKRDKNISQLRPINVHIASEQYGCWEKINFKRGDPLSHVSADSHNPLKSPWVYRLKRTGMHCPPPSADVPDFLTLCGTQNPRKVITSHGLETCPQQISASSQYHGDLNDLMREGTGQNFVDEDNQNKSNTESRVKRLKTALAD